MELGVRVNAGSDHEAEDTPLDSFSWPSVDIHGMKQARKAPSSERFSVNPSDQPASKPLIPNRALPGDFGPASTSGLPDSDAIAAPLGMASAHVINRAYSRSRRYS